MAQLGVILAEYPEDTILHVTSPRTGLQRRKTWPPSISEVVQACDDFEAYKRRVAEANRWRERAGQARIAPPSPAPGADFESMFAKHGRPIGPFEEGRERPYGVSR